MLDSCTSDFCAESIDFPAAEFTDDDERSKSPAEELAISRPEKLDFPVRKEAGKRRETVPGVLESKRVMRSKVERRAAGT